MMGRPAKTSAADAAAVNLRRDAVRGSSPTAHYKYAAVAIIALLLIAPYFIYPVFIMKVLCFALFASALNLLLGFGGLLSFGHAAFFGMASYTVGYATKIWGLSPEFSILFGVLVATALGGMIGLLAIRRSGIYFAMVTLAFAQMIYFFAVQSPFTGGEDGLQAIPRRPLFGVIDMSNDMSIYWLVAAIFLIGLFIVYRVVHSPFGEVLRAIRENEQRAISLGYRVQQYKLLTFVLSAGLAGLAGGTKALVFQIASLVDVHWSMSGEVVLMTLIGGMGTIFGPIAGAALIVWMQNYLADIGSWVVVVQGLVFVVCVLLFREGIVGVLARLIKRKL